MRLVYVGVMRRDRMGTIDSRSMLALSVAFLGAAAALSACRSPESGPATAPAATLVIDCQADRSLCDAGGCAQVAGMTCPDSNPLTPIRISRVPARIRLPTAPGVDPACASVCQTTVYAFNVVIDVDEPSLQDRNLVVRTLDPWRVALGHEGYARVLCDDAAGHPCYVPADVMPTTCLGTYGPRGSIGISTTDPNANGGSVTIDALPPGVSYVDACP